MRRMFTGIIERLGRVEAITPSTAGSRLRISVEVDSPLTRGESVAVNGVCLTALPNEDGSFEADLSPETLQRTSLRTLTTGSMVNIERALALGNRLSGHIVQGHVDATGRVASVKREGDFATIRWNYPREFAPLVVSKGSITVDGISLTVVEPDESSFAVAVIPETLARTTLGRTHVGDEVNLEFDIIAKFVRQLVAPYLPGMK
jgi:riboflavin synthase